MVNPTKHFKSKSKPIVVHTKQKDEKEQEIILDWKIKPLSPRLMVKNYKHFAALEKLNKGKEEKQLSEEEEIETLEKLAPLIDVVLPFCCLEPQVVMEGETNEKQVNIDDLDVQTLMELFSEIFKASGVSKEAEAERVNLVPSPSLKQSQPSA